ncbi:MAG TPA: right-handed parallel beta-helix repeat-containing protein [Thermoanaerobaculia bacterium]|jgi:predicted outer membrane repeat protein|nr:right-handed parallel beta-helix repeat-containing protein [Thermoanaerobaculia bacterium]
MLRFAWRSLAVVFLLLPAGPALAAPQTVRVPQDAKDLQQAINTVADGGVIEVAANTYRTPPRGYSIENAKKGFTVRAVGTVVLDGQGVNQLLRYENGKRDRGKLVTFEGIAFRNGFSETEAYAGGVTMSAAEARFVGCVFEDNQATGRTSGGGAVRINAGSEATFADTSFRRNSSLNRGGAIEIIDSAVTIQGGELAENRTNLPGHKPSSSGGAVYLLNGNLKVSGARFRANQAGWVGGAIYAFGVWSDPDTNPRSLVQVSRSTFDGNLAAPDSGVTAPGPTTGGAIHVEDQSTLEIDSSVLSNNVAEFGGAVDSYRALVAVRGSWFFGNRSPLTGSFTGAGGGIHIGSADFVDASTGSGAINRRPARLTLSDSLLQGGVGSVANTGGCLIAGGDGSRVYGENGVPAAGTLEENRARVEIRRTVFADCDIEPTATNGAGSGGAIAGDLVDLLMEDSMVLDSDARGAVGSGGGMAIGRESNAVITRTTFARNSAERWGGALFVSGSAVQVSESNFFNNEISPGTSEAVSQSRGAALFSMPLSDPNHPRNVSGLVSSSVFSANVGIPVWDNEPASGPLNLMRYNGNPFYSTTFGTLVYVHNKLAPGGASAAELNFLPGKSDGGNTRLTSAPALGAVLAVPPFLGAGAGSSGRTFLAYAWSGRSATLAGQSLPNKAGLLEVTAAGDYTLAVDGGAVDSARVAASACTSGPSLCLNGDRFVAEVTWKDFQGKTGMGQAVSLTSDTGYFWFFNESNVELVVKVLDGRPLNGNYWVFYGSLSNVEYTLKVTDTVTGRIRTYRNSSGRFASAGDTSAFPAGKTATVALADPEAIRPETAAAASNCVPGPTDLCLNGGRFRVSLDWKAQGTQGAGQAVPLTADTGYFWFFSPSNVEVAIKVLDGRGLNGHFWVFYGALTNVEYEITVTDTQTGSSVSYRNPAGQFGSRGDTSALPE